MNIFLKPAISGMQILIDYAQLPRGYCLPFQGTYKYYEENKERKLKYDRKDLLKCSINSVYSQNFTRSSYAVILEDSQKTWVSQNSGLIYINKSRKCFPDGFFIISLTNARKIGKLKHLPDLQLLFLWGSCSQDITVSPGNCKYSLYFNQFSPHSPLLLQPAQKT